MSQFLSVPTGLYLVSRPKNVGPGTHYAIADVGNILEHPYADGSIPIIMHKLMGRGFCIEYIQPRDKYRIEKRITDVGAAKRRLIAASRNPSYDLFGANCEHFARYVAEGNHKSLQISSAVGLIGLAALTFAAYKWSDSEM